MACGGACAAGQGLAARLDPPGTAARRVDPTPATASAPRRRVCAPVPGRKAPRRGSRGAHRVSNSCATLVSIGNEEMELTAQCCELGFPGSKIASGTLAPALAGHLADLADESFVRG